MDSTQISKPEILNQPGMIMHTYLVVILETASGYSCFILVSGYSWNC